MKTLLAIVASGALFTGPAFAIDASELREAYSSDAFENDGSVWRRTMAKRYDECSFYGSRQNTRLEVLLTRYYQIGSAFEAGNEAGAVKAAEALAQTIAANSRFAGCWDLMARRGGVDADFRKLIEKA